mgnify:CR=1 FL=1
MHDATIEADSKNSNWILWTNRLVVQYYLFLTKLASLPFITKQATTTHTSTMTESTSFLFDENGSSLNLDLYQGAADVLDRLRTVKPEAILHVSLEYNLMAEIVYDQEWMDIFDEISNLPKLKTISLSFRVPVPLPIQALTTFIKQAKSLETLNISGLQLSIPPPVDSESSIETLTKVFRNAQLLKTVQLCRHRTFRGDASAKATQEVDPLLRALTSLPNLKVFHIDRTDIFTDQTTLELVCSAPIRTLKIGVCDRDIRLGQYLPRMADSLETNNELKELMVHHILRGKDLAAMAELLEHNTSLKKVALRVESNDFGNVIANALRNNTTMESFDLTLLSRDRACFRKNMVVIAEALSENRQSALKSLRLDGAKGIRSSAMMMEPFLKMLQQYNYTLQQLEINRNNVTLSAEIQFYLKLNRLGRRYLLRVEGEGRQETSRGNAVQPRQSNGSFVRSSPSFREEFANCLIQNKNDLRVLFYFLSRNPLILPLS